MLGLPPGRVEHARIIVLVDVGHPWRQDPDQARAELANTFDRLQRLAGDLHGRGPDNRLDLIVYGTPWWTSDAAPGAPDLASVVGASYPTLSDAMLASAGQLADDGAQDGVAAVVHITSGALDIDDLSRSLEIVDGTRSTMDGVIFHHIVMMPGVVPLGSQDARSWPGITRETTLPGRIAMLLTSMASPIPPGVWTQLAGLGYPEVDGEALMLVPGTTDDFVDLAYLLWMLAIVAPEPSIRLRESSRLLSESMAAIDSEAPVAPAGPMPMAGRQGLDDDGGVDVPQPIYADENVQFTVYRPERIRPASWYSMLAFAHLSEARDAMTEPDPVVEVRRQAGQVLGPDIGQYRTASQDSAYAVPERGELTFVPDVRGVDFNPPSRSFLWTESVHREEFRLRATKAVDGDVARGRLTVYLGRIILAEVNLTFRLERTGQAAATLPLTPVSAHRHRRIFPSYSHHDAGVVAELREYALAVGDEYMQDVLTLRAGERWSDRLRELIREADIFQLFWSQNAMHSPHVRTEWEHALALGRPDFIRPIYWELPMPRSESPPLPPPDLDALHFRMVTVNRRDDRARGRKFRKDDESQWDRDSRALGRAQTTARKDNHARGGMFKKNDASEWTRFSRAIGGAQTPAWEDDLATADEPEEPAILARAVPSEPEVYLSPPPPPPSPAAVVEQDETTMPAPTPPSGAPPSYPPAPGPPLYASGPPHGTSHPDPVTPRAPAGYAPPSPPVPGYCRAMSAPEQYLPPQPARGRARSTRMPVVLGLAGVLLLVVVIFLLLRYLGVL